MSLPGGLSEAHEATPETQALVDQVKSNAEKEAGVDFSTYEATSYKTQVVNGTNYFVKVFVGGTKYVHLRIYIPPSGEPVRLDGILQNKTCTADDPINYFDIITFLNKRNAERTAQNLFNNSSLN